ncbi:MAG: hypothetical protein V4792_13015 [Pseudomonadota bacterium]
MFGRSKPVVFERYGRRRSRWRLPRWLLLLLAGLAAGAGGVILLQERYLPPRLSAEATRELRSAFEQADAERKQLKTRLDATGQQLDAALAAKKRQDEELAAPRATAQRLRDDMAALIATLPPDPRGGAVEVRAGRFAAQGGVLAYDVVLTRERDTVKPLAGVMQLSVTGLSARGAEATATLKPVDVSLGSQALVRGSLPLPEGFKPRQATVQVLDRAGGKPMGMRVMLVK